jgi:hypothetical protein
MGVCPAARTRAREPPVSARRCQRRVAGRQAAAAAAAAAADRGGVAFFVLGAFAGGIVFRQAGSNITGVQYRYYHLCKVDFCTDGEYTD